MTEGERIAGRELETEQRMSSVHYKPGQHFAKLAEDHTGEGGDCYELTFVNPMGFLVWTLWTRIDDDWRLALNLGLRAGQHTVFDDRLSPEAFVLTARMRQALDEAEIKVKATQILADPRNVG